MEFGLGFTAYWLIQIIWILLGCAFIGMTTEMLVRRIIGFIDDKPHLARDCWVGDRVVFVMETVFSHDTGWGVVRFLSMMVFIMLGGIAVAVFRDNPSDVVAMAIFKTFEVIVLGSTGLYAIAHYLRQQRRIFKKLKKL